MDPCSRQQQRRRAPGSSPPLSPLRLLPPASRLLTSNRLCPRAAATVRPKVLRQITTTITTRPFAVVVTIILLHLTCFFSPWAILLPLSSAMPLPPPHHGDGIFQATSRGGRRGGSNSDGGGHIGGSDEKVEGCFNRFDAWEVMSFPPGAPPPNNLICQDRCSLAGYALAATRGAECSCGNDYPSVFHQVETSQCNLPCAPDKASCFLFTCCGSTEDSLYTVSFSRPVDVVLQLLRKLAFDYRHSSPVFLNKIEGELSTWAGLQVSSSEDASSNPSTRHRSFLGVSDGCPLSWTRYADKCYRLHWAEPRPFTEAQGRCWDEGGDVVSITSPQENQYVTELHHGCIGWLNTKQEQSSLPSSSSSLSSIMRAATSMRSKPSSSHEPSSNMNHLKQHGYGKGDSSSTISVRRVDALPPSDDDGFARGASLSDLTFDDFALASSSGASPLQRVHSIRWGYHPGKGRVLSLQATYQTATGQLFQGPLYQARPLRPSTTKEEVMFLDLSSEGLVGAQAMVVGGYLINLAFITARPNGTLTRYDYHHVEEGDDDEGETSIIQSRRSSFRPPEGPSSVIKYMAQGPVVGLYGTMGKTRGLRSLGFYEREVKSCGIMDGDGSLVAVDCNVQAMAAAICERPPAHGALCSSGSPGSDGGGEIWWAAALGSCYAVLRPEGLTAVTNTTTTNWLSFHSACHKLGSYLVAISSKEEKELVHSLLGSEGGAIGLFRPARSLTRWLQQQEPATWAWDLYDPSLSISTPFRSISDYYTELPHKHKQQRRCVILVATTGELAVVNCRERARRAVVCESPARASDGVVAPHGPRVDGCPASAGEWIRYLHSCYLNIGGDDPVNWFEAQAMCWRHSSMLVSVDSPDENAFLSWLLLRRGHGDEDSGSGVQEAYLALNDLLTSGRFLKGYFHNVTSPTTTAATIMMAAHESSGDNTVDGDGSCMVLLPDGGWAATDCEGVDGDYLVPNPGGAATGATCYVCEKAALPAAALLQPQETEEWDIIQVSTPTSDGGKQLPPECGAASCEAVFIRRRTSGQYLRCDPDSHVLVLYPSESQRPPPPFYARFVDSGAASFSLLQELPGYGIATVVVVSPEPAGRAATSDWNTLLCRLPAQYRDDDAGTRGMVRPAIFTTTRPVQAFAERALSVAVVTRSDDLMLPGLQECSLGLYDTSPQSLSYTCRPVLSPDEDGGGVGVDVLWFEQQSLLFFDEARYVSPRVPLRNARVRCENEHPTSIAACSIAYGQGITFTRIITLDWNYIIQDTITNTATVDLTFTPNINLPAFPGTVAAAANGGGGNNRTVSSGGGGAAQPEGEVGGGLVGGAVNIGEAPSAGETEGGGGGGEGDEETANVLTPGQFNLEASIQNDFTIFFQNIYEVVFIAAVVETRNWQLTVPVPARTVANIQLWLQTVRLNYRWRALFAARGGMRIKYFDDGMYLGSHHSIADLTSYEDRYFYVFGRYDLPREASITITVDNRDGYNWPIDLPPTSTGDQVSPGARTGQLGYGYR